MSLASMGIYVFEWSFLREILREDAADPTSAHDFGHNIIPKIVKDGSAYAHRFSESCVMTGHETRPYWRDVGTVDAFWQANIDLTAFIPDLDLYDNSWPIWTYSELVPPAKFVHDEDGRRGSAVQSMVSGGCIISGAEVKNSMLFTNTRLRSYSELDHAILLPGAHVERSARLTNCVIDSGVVVPEGLVIGEDPEEDARWFRRTESGITLVTQPMLDRRGELGQ